MVNMTLKRYRLEAKARIFIAIGLIFVLLSWVAGWHYYMNSGKGALFIAPLVFTCVTVLLLLVIGYRYTIFKKYPYLMNLPSLLYRIKDKRGANNQSIAFSMIFTVHALVIAFMGLLSLVLVLAIGSSSTHAAASQILYVYFILIALLIASVLLQYRRIYLKFA
jgi:hypothetical protein